MSPRDEPTEIISLFDIETQQAPGLVDTHVDRFEQIMMGQLGGPTVIRYRRRRKSLNHWVLFGVAAAFFVLGVLWAPTVWGLI